MDVLLIGIEALIGYLYGLHFLYYGIAAQTGMPLIAAVLFLWRAVPVVSRVAEVLGALLFAHPDVSVVTNARSASPRAWPRRRDRHGQRPGRA